jgi:hypothetical protein
LIYYANTAANFLLYFLTADVFRQELRVMILSLPGCSKLLPEYCRNDAANPAGRGGVTGMGFVATAAVQLGKTQLTTLPLLNPAPGYSSQNTSDYKKRNGDNKTDLTTRPNDPILTGNNKEDDGSNDEYSPL